MNRSSDITLLVRAFKFAADKHRYGTRKDKATPYINHPIDVANILTEAGGVTDTEVLAAAVLHDTIEDTETTEDELRTVFGERVLGLVLECTDDKTLTKEERKRLQVVHAPEKSSDAKLIKIADKISNMRDIAHNPPPTWPMERRKKYIEWANDVFAGLQGVNAGLDELFRKTAQETETALNKESQKV